MTQVWVYRIGAAAGENLDEHLRQAGIDGFESTPWVPFRSNRGGPILVLCAGDWRKFTRTEYFGAAEALALHESGVVKVLPVIEAGEDTGPQPDPWMERYRLLWNRLDALSREKAPITNRPAPASTSGPVSIFFSYSHEDEELRGDLERHLSLLERTGLIKGWTDRKIIAGRDWAAEIDRHLYTSDMILLLLSSDFFASDYCSEIETPVALARHQANSARAIPILLRPVEWRLSALATLGALPKDARPVTDWPSKDAAFVNVCEGILNSALDWSHATEAEPDVQRPVVPKVIRTATRKRTLDAAMPAIVDVDKSAMLVVLVRKASSPGLRGVVAADPTYGIDEGDVKSRAVILEFPIDPGTGKPGPLSIAIKVSAPEFDPPFQTRPLTVAPDYDSQPCIFLLAAKQPGKLVVLVEAYQGENCLVSCPIRTTAVTEKVWGGGGRNIVSASFDSSSLEEDDGKTIVLRQIPPPMPQPAPPPAPQSVPPQMQWDYVIRREPPKSAPPTKLLLVALLILAIGLFFVVPRVLAVMNAVIKSLILK
jgi:TIR domain